MALDATGRDRVAAQFQRELTGPAAWTKPQLAAVAAVDAWCDANQAAFNAALPTAFRTTATAVQKADLLCFVVQRRQGRLRIAEDG